MVIVALKDPRVWWHIHLIHALADEYILLDWSVKLHDENGIALGCGNKMLVIPEHNVSGILIVQGPQESDHASS